MCYVLTGTVSEKSDIRWNQMTKPYYVIDIHLDDDQTITYLLEYVSKNEYNGDGPLTVHSTYIFSQDHYTLYSDDDHICMTLTDKCGTEVDEIGTYVQAKKVLDKELYDALYFIST